MRRHPNIFGTEEEKKKHGTLTAEEALAQWNKIKASEKRGK